MNLTPHDPTSRIESDRFDAMPRMGEWYWIKEVQPWDSEKRKKGDTYEWLGCVMIVGSNFVELHAPHGSSYSTRRVHIDEFETVLRFEPDADSVISKNVAYWQDNTNSLMRKITDLHASLGLRNADAITDQTDTSTALAVLSGQEDVKAYENALVTAKKETLPKLFDEIEESNKEIARWMQARTMPLLAQIKPLKGRLEEINSRIFNISLYAGLTEQVELVTEGAAPAAIDEKLHVMQRRLYMDEECLLQYTAGGMEFKDIGAFDKWIANPENRDRLLPFQRTLAAFQVRRNDKERDSENNLGQMFINMQMRNADKFTYLYIRNGDQVWRMSCEMDFGELIFPDATHLDPGEPMMVKMFANKPDGFLPTSRYEYLLARWHEVEAERKAWDEANPDQKIRNPHGGFLGMGDRQVDGIRFNPGDWRPFDHSNVYYDETMASLARQIKEYNRVALIIQGLFDRSQVLHPHKPVRSWTQEGFEEAITLVYDGTATLYHGDTPDFEAYRSKLNASIKIGSVVAGADDYWARAEAVKECRRRARDWRDKSGYRPNVFRPYGNPGPGLLAVVAAKTRSSVTLRWRRESTRNSMTMIDASITIPISALLNVSAYTPGEFRQFYRDPRTRESYLKWAPLMLVAEDFHAGKRTVRSADRFED